MTTIEIELTPRLRLAADYIHEHGHTKGTMEDKQGRVCLTGAVQKCAPQNGDQFLIRAVLQKRDRGELWNDRAETTAAQVEDYLRTAEITDRDLADTFGPQWESVVRIVRRAAQITPAEIDRLTAAGDAVWGVAGDAAGDAAWGVAARDLIGQHRFTQERYDTLTRPWRKVIGQIHPDDLDIYEASE